MAIPRTKGPTPPRFRLLLLAIALCAHGAQAQERALRYAYRDRRRKKGDFRRLWITRINAAARQHDISYSRLIAGLAKAGVQIDRKMLADLAVHDAEAFAKVAELAKSQS